MVGLTLAMRDTVFWSGIRNWQWVKSFNKAGRFALYKKVKAHCGTKSLCTW